VFTLLTSPVYVCVFTLLTSPVYVCVFAKGGELFDRIVDHGPLGEDEARVVMRRLLRGIQYLHNKGIVHRDLKPENILMGGNEVGKASELAVKISDFGLAKVVPEEGLKTYCGSPQYFAPEIVRRSTTLLGQGRYGRGVDLWSLGVVMYVVLAGQPPFQTRELLDKVGRLLIDSIDMMGRLLIDSIDMMGRLGSKCNN
jgi:phosphorylase kinase gamma subunit/serine/threonine-protein kinase Chk2/calcium/calmodulin-dependent protein kinase I